MACSLIDPYSVYSGMKIFSLSARPPLLFALLTLILSGCDDTSERPADHRKTWQAPVITVFEDTLDEEYTVVGSIVAEKRIDISSRISGYIHQLPLQEGDTVKAGDLIVVLDSRDVENAVSQAQAAVDAARAVFNDIEADLARFETLLRQQSISDVQVRKARLQRDTAVENLNAAKAALSAAIAQRQYVRILSPTAGIVTTRHKQPGSLATPGAPLLTIESRDELKFETFVAESQLAKIHADDAVTVKVDNVAELVKGKVSQIIYAGDPVTRSYKVNVSLPPLTHIYSGMFGAATFIVGQSNNVTVPTSALVDNGGLTGVFVVDEEHVARFRWLRIRRHWPDKVEVASGLSAGEKIVSEPPTGLREGGLIQTPDTAGE